MPAVIIGAVLAGAAAGIVAGSLVTGLIIAGLSIVGSLLAPDIPGFSAEARDRGVNAKATAEPKTLVIGEVALGGQLALFESTGASKEFLHIVVAHADHPCDAIDGWLANNEPAGDRDSAGAVTAGRFAGHLRLVGHLGALDQAAAPNLVAEVTNWTEEHKGGGVAYSEARLKWSADVWPNGFTGLRAVVRGMPVYDPRDTGATITASDLATPAVFATAAPHGLTAGQQVWVKNHLGAIRTVGGQPIRFAGKWHQVASVPTTSTLTLIDLDGQPVNFTTAGTGGTVTQMAWSDNWALAVRMYLTHRASYDAQDDEIDDTVTAASANICDEQVALTPEPKTFVIPTSGFTVDVDNDLLLLADDMPFVLGTAVRVASTVTPPAPLVAGTVYYAVPASVEQPFETELRFAGRQLRSLQFFTGPVPLDLFTVVNEGIRLAASAADAEAGSFITLTDAGTGTHTIADAGDQLVLTVPRTWKGGDVVQLTTTGTLPAGLALATDYYVIREDAATIQLATTLENARARVAIAITDAGAGDHTATRVSQLRYTANGVIRLGQDPHRPLDQLMTAAAGTVVTEGGMVKIYAGAATAVTGTTDESDMRDADLDVVPSIDWDNVFNAVRGTFVDPDKYWTEGDAPSYANALYRAEDNGDLKYTNMPLAFTTDPVMATRLFKIALERARQGATVKFPAKPRKYGTAVWDVEELTIGHLGYAAKEFRVMGWSQAEDFGIDILYREEAAANWDWALGDETVVDPAPDSNLPDPLNIDPPAGLSFAESLYETRDGSGVKARAVLTWMDADNIFVTDGGGYQLAYKLAVDPEFIVRPVVSPAVDRIDDIAPGVYDFKVRSISVLDAKSPYGPVLTKEVFGLSAAPAAPQDVTISAIGGLAVIRWALAAELDVREGGKYKFRHSPLFTGAAWAASTSIAGVDGEAIDGKQTSAALPLKPGSYLVRALDSSGIQSPAVIVTTKQASVLAYTDTDTLAEHPAWLGTHTGTAGADGILKLAGVTLLDDWGTLDSVAQWDIEGGLLQAGTYDFAGNFDFLSVVRRRLTVAPSVLVVNTLNTIDQRTANMDSWESWDGTDTGSADAVVWVRHTDDDPAGSPTWTSWERLDSAEFEARAFQFQARLSATDPAYNIHVSTLIITAAEVA